MRILNSSVKWEIFSWLINFDIYFKLWKLLQEREMYVFFAIWYRTFRRFINSIIHLKLKGTNGKKKKVNVSSGECEVKYFSAYSAKRLQHS